jgi:hypothetical protein
MDTNCITAPTIRLTRAVIVGTALSLTLGACSASDRADSAPLKAAAPAPVSAPRGAAELLTAIQIEIGRPACTSDNQCRSLPIGHKACGGPEGYLAWSSTVSNESRLLAWAAQHTQARRQEVQARGMMSDCQVQADPGAVCRQGLCVPGETARVGGGGDIRAR